MISNTTQEDNLLFNYWFSCSRRLLYFIARRVLDSDEGAEAAVRNCWLTASRNPPTFESEGAFRSWLLRVLIDEALVLRENKGSTSNLSEQVVAQERGMAQPLYSRIDDQF